MAWKPSPVSADAIELEKDAAHADALNDSAGRFELVAKGADFLDPRGSGCNTNTGQLDNKYKCLDCGYVFRTNLDAMKRHAAEHDSGNVVCVYKNKDPKNAGEFYRPSGHRVNRQTGRAESDGNFFCALVPDKFKSVDGHLTCDLCQKCQIKFSEEWPAKKQACSVAHFKRHYEKFHLNKTDGGEGNRNIEDVEPNN